MTEDKDMYEMTRSIKRIAIIGDNRISSSITNALHRNASIQIHQIVPPHSTATDISELTLHKSDLTPASLKTIFATISPDLLITTTSGSNYPSQKLILDTAIQTDIPRFIPSEFGHDTLNPKIQERLPPCRERARLIEYLQTLSSKNQIKWVGIATGYLLDHGLQSVTLGFDLKWQSATLHGTGNEAFAASSIAWIGRVVAAVAEHWDEVANQYIYVSRTMVTANEIVKCLKEISGKEWEVGRADVEECVWEAERRVERGWPDAGMFLLERNVLYDETLGAARPFRERSARELLGLEEESVEGIVRSALRLYEHHGDGGCGCD